LARGARGGKNNFRKRETYWRERRKTAYLLKGGVDLAFRYWAQGNTVKKEKGRNLSTIQKGRKRNWALYLSLTGLP